MQVTVKETGELGREVAVSVPASTVDGAVDARIAELAKTVKIKGFRPGKVPVRVVKERYAAAARHDVLEKHLPEYAEQALTQEKLQPAGFPHVDITVSEPGKDFEFLLKFDVYPVVKLASFGGIKVEQIAAEITDQDVEDALRKLQEQFVEWKEVNRAAAKDDQVTIDFEGFLDDKPFDGGKAEKVPLVLGSNSMIPGFEDGIVGMKAGESRDIEVTFPADYHADSLAGQKTKFAITVHTVCAPELPAIDDALAKRAGKFKNEKDLREQMRKTMEKELDGAIKMVNKSAVLDKLLELNTLTLPTGLVEQEMERMREQTLQHYRRHLGKDVKLPELEKSMFKPEAERRVKLGLLLDHIVKTESFSAAAEKVRALVEESAQTYDEPQHVIDWYYADTSRLAPLEGLVVEDQAIAHLLQAADVQEKTVPYNEALKLGYQSSHRA